jgi:hypothetical protein
MKVLKKVIYFGVMFVFIILAITTNVISGNRFEAECPGLDEPFIWWFGLDCIKTSTALIYYSFYIWSLLAGITLGLYFIYGREEERKLF